MRDRPLVAVTGAWVVGNALFCMFDGKSFWLFWGGLALMLPAVRWILRFSWRRILLLWLVLALGAGWWSYHDNCNQSKISQVIEAGAGTLLSGVGEPSDQRYAVTLQGTIVSDIEIDGDRADFILSTQSIMFNNKSLVSASNMSSQASGLLSGSSTDQQHSAREKVAVQLKLATKEELQEAERWHRGQYMMLDGELVRPMVARNFESFDYRTYLYYQRIHWIMKAQSVLSAQVSEGEASVAKMLGYVDKVRSRLGERISELFPEWQAGYMKGLLIGLVKDLEPDKYDQFSQLGLTHILAISGSHVAINVGLIFGVLRYCRVTKERSLQIVFWLIPAYVLITGLSPSVIRSGLMTMLGIHLLRRGLLKDGLNVLAAVALLMLVIEPYYLVNVSFQLSFIVTAGLIVVVPLLLPYLKWLPPKIAGAISITIAAQIVSFPVTIYYFNQFSLLSLAANLLLVPLIGMISLPGGTAALLASLVWLPLGQALAYPVRWLNHFTFDITGWLNARDGFMMYWKSPSLLWIVTYYIVMYWLLYLANRRRILQATQQAGVEDTIPLEQAYKSNKPEHWQQWTNRRFTPFSIILSYITTYIRSWMNVETWIRLLLTFGMVVLLYNGYRPLYDKRGMIQFLDVGQGDSILITTPRGRNILVDGGGTVFYRKPEDSWRERKDPYEVGAKMIVPLLKKRGIHKLDAVIVTHGDHDHVGGLRAVLEHFPVDALIMNGTLADSSTMNSLMLAALGRKIPIYAASAGQGLKVDSQTSLEFLHPLRPAIAKDGIRYSKDQNYESIVFLLQMDHARILFTGDMDKKAELQVLGRLARLTDSSVEQIDMMKAAHHGSKTSTSAEWLNYWRPKATVISAGQGNLYGHPHPDVVLRLHVFRSGIYRTDQQGEIQIKVSERTIHLRHKLESGG